MFKAENHSETCWNLDFFYIRAYKKKIQVIAYFTHMLKFIKHEENLNYSFIYM